MKTTAINKQRLFFVLVFIIGFLFISSAQEVATFTPRLAGDNIEIKGDIIFVGNNILNTATEADPSLANTPYNGSDNNNALWMEYIDIDGDVSTFSSSSAELNITDPDCSEVRYAGLYWAATYPNERSTDSGEAFIGTDRIEDWFNIKFQIPGGSYVDLSADTATDPVGEEDDIIYDGYNYANINNSFKDSPYVCYKNVTNLVQTNSNPNGNYTVANIRATKGVRDGSSSAGWVLVIIYENPNESGKFISTFDGYAGMSDLAGSVDVPVNGFKTLPSPFPVRSRVGVATLEGDRGILNDQFFIKANSNSVYTNLSTGLNPADNFFNSTITTNGLEVPTRIPYGTNTLGIDLDIFDISNPPGNTILPNDETGATLRFTSTGDGYGAFLTAFAVEIIEPEIILEKRVEDIAGNDITNLGVNLGQTLDYVLSFQNLGNDNAIGYEIRDVFPINTSYISYDISGAPGVTSSINTINNEITFFVPDNLVEIGDPKYTIRLRVKVAENCFDFIDACTNQIENLAYSTYQGEINNAIITDDPSVYNFDICGHTTPGSTNFLLDDLAACTFTTTVQLCGEEIVLDAGDGFDSYIWVKDENEDNIIDSSDTILNDGDPDADPSTLIIQEEGIYIVDKIVADPCKGFQEIFIVQRFGSSSINPIVSYFNTVNNDTDVTNDIEGEIATCSVDGDSLPKIFLCGLTDSQILETNITNVQNISWEILDESSCTAGSNDCANKNLNCTWNTLATGSTYTVNDPGKYRIVVTYQNGCFNRFYFDVFRNNLDIIYNTNDIVCTTEGSINITNLGTDYGFQLIDITNNSIVIPFSANNGPNFSIATSGMYRVEAIQLDSSGNPIADACLFSTPDIGILNRQITVDIETTPSNCNNQGTIKIDINNVFPDYTYTLKRLDGIVIDDETAQSNNTHTFSVNEGDYIVEAEASGGCFYTETVTVSTIDDPTLSALTTSNIGCSAGTITLSQTGGLGNPNFLYAIWSKDSIDLYPNITSIPPGAFQIEQVFTFGWRDSDGDGIDEYFPGEDGEYIFIIADANGCTAFSNPEIINDDGTMSINSINEVQPSCDGDSNGSITINILGGVGPFSYSIDDGATTQGTSTFAGLSAGIYKIKVTDSSGCEVSQTYDLLEPTTFSATASVTSDISCDPLNGADVSINNVTGGTIPYTFSFDGGATFGTNQTATLMPGTYNLIARDAFCDFPMTVVVDDMPSVPTINSTVDYNCDGTGNITVTPDIGTYNYTYAIDGVLNTPNTTSNAFSNLAVGNYTITTIYVQAATATATNPEVCELSIDTPISIIAGNEFAAYGTGSTDVSCNGLTDGTITFEVENFDATAGFEYSVDGGTTYSTSTSSPITTAAVFGAGSQTVLIRRTDDTSCTFSVTRTINEPTPVVASASITEQFTCNNTGATITASANGGTTTYVYQLEDNAGTVIGSFDFANNGSNNIFTGLAAGNYIVVARDINNCTDSIDTALNVIATNNPTFDLTPTTCYLGASAATILVDVTSIPGNGGFQFSINGGPWIIPTNPTDTSYTFSNLANGTYTIDVQDAFGCAAGQQSITINPQITVTATTDNITACATDTNVTITAAGGDGNYVYALVPDGVTPNPSDFGALNVIAATAIGDYDVYVRDNSGAANYCTAMFDINIAQDGPIDITETLVHNLCFGGTIGSISIAVTGGEAPYEYSFNSAAYDTPNAFNNLAAGTYSVSVKDNNGCIIDTSFIITEPIGLTAEAVITQEYTCLIDGEITVGSVTPTTGGSGNYQYSINGSSWTATTTGGNTFTGLTDGTYSIQVRDPNATTCATTLADIVIDPLPVEPTISTTLEYNCDGTASVTILPLDGTYTYNLNGSNFVTTNVFNNIAVGTYPISINYGRDCTTASNVTIENGFTFEAAINSFTNPTCNTNTDGTITINVANFGTEFQYSLDGGATYSAVLNSSPFTITGLSSGAQNIIVRYGNDTDNGCPINLNQTLTQPTPVVTSASVIEQFTCNNTGATITASANGGTPTYVYQLEDNAGGVIGSFDFATNGNNTLFTGLASGNYIVVARDLNNCSDSIDAVINIVTPNNPTFNTVGTSCYSGANDGTIQVDVTSLPGNGGFQFSLDGAPWVNPGTTTHTFTNLANGSYTIDVRDTFGCTATQQIVVLNSQLRATTTLQPDLTCAADATITIDALGGSGTYVYEWSTTNLGPWNTTGFTANVYNTNTAGSYFFRISDSTTPTVCTFITEEVVVSPIDTPVITSITASHLNCNGDNSGVLDIIIDTTVGLAPYTINVVNTTTSTTYGAQTSGLTAGVYEVTVTDAKGCFITETETINEPNEITYTVSSIPIECDSSGSDPNNNTTPGEISVSGISGGTAEYTYYLTANNGIPTQTYNTTSGARDHTFTILSFGIYQIDIVDANGCASFSTEIIASPPNGLDIDVSTSTANCADGGTAIVTVDASVGSGTYEFAVLESFTPPYSANYVGPDISGGDTATFSSVANGIHLNPGVTYTFVVFDTTTKCYYFETSALPVDTPSNMTATLDAIGNVTCTGSADGTISFTFDNYDIGASAVGYEIFDQQSNISTGIIGSSSVNPPTGAITVNNFATLAPGEYYLLLSEVGGAYTDCTINGGSFTIRESVNTLDVTVEVTKNDNCNVNAGVITATGQFGTAPYEYQILPTGSTGPTVTTWAGTSNNTFNVEGGNYDVYIKDDYDCIQFNTINLPTDVSPEISLAIVDECATEGNFEVLVTLDQAGLSPYSLSVNGSAFKNVTFNGSNEYTVTGLSSGASQTIEISDLNGCGETENITIYPSYSASVTPTKLLDCTASPNAEITISASGGSDSFEYEITGPVTQVRTALPSPANSTVWNLASASGTYTVSIYDVNTPSCPATTFPVEIATRLEPIFDTILPTDVTCNNADDGTIIASVVNNGIGNYTFQITSLDGAVVTINPTSNTATFATFTGLVPTTTAAGYIITVTADSATNNCPTNSSSIVIDEPNPIAVTLDPVVEFACSPGNGNNQNSASISVASVNGGSTNYVRYEFIDNKGTVATADDDILQTGTSTTYTETNTAGGNYTINVYDDKGCLGTAAATIEAFDELISATTNITSDITCNPGNDAEITITVTSTNSDATKYEFSIDGGTTWQNTSNSATPNVFSGLGINTHNFIVRHADTGCTLNTSDIVVDPNTFDIVVDKTSDVICFGTDTGAVNFAITDATYTAGFNYQVFEQITNTPITTVANHPNLGPTATVNLGAGDYYVIITQDNNPLCENREDFSIAGPDADITGATDITPITCVGNDGVIDIISVLGGWGNYNYYVGTVAPTVAGDYNTNPSFNSLAPGTYEAWVIDQQGCQRLIQDNIVLVDTTPITATLDINIANCTNLEGEIHVTSTAGGQGSNYSYQLQMFDGTSFVDFRTAQTTITFSGLGVGQYQVIVTDEWTCTVTTNIVELFDTIVPLASITKTIDCTTTPGGEITITQTGGSGSLSYDVIYPDGITTDNNTTGVFNNLTQTGIYTFTLTDQATGHLCVKNIQIELLPVIYPQPTIDAFTNVTCNTADDGTINVSVPDNGVGPYTFTIISGPGSTATFPIAATSNTVTSARFENLEGLAAGITYTIRATAANQCFVDIDQVILQPDAIANVNATVLEYLCTAGNNQNNATITIDPSAITGGSSNYVRYEFINTTTSTTVQDGSNNVYTETNLAGGNYTINVYDDKGCLGSTTTNIVAYDELVSATVTPTSIVCSGTDITIEAIGSITNSTANAGNYEFREVTNPASAFTTSNVFQNLAIGVHIFEAKNSTTGCIIQTEYIVEDPNTFTPTVTTVTNVICNGTDSGQVTLEITDTVYTGTFNWEIFNTNNTPTNTADDISEATGTGMVANTTTNPIALGAGSYRISVTQATNPGCTSERFFSITEPEVITLNASEQANPTCSDEQGSILVSPTGGEAPYSITLTNTTTGQTYTQVNVNAYLFEDLSGGVYDISITDNISCTQIFASNITFQTPDVIDASATQVALTCFNENNASITAIVATRTFPATPVYEYQLNVYDTTGTSITQTSVAQSSPVFNGLSAGNYSVTVTDDFGCSDETPLEVIVNPTEVSAQLIRTQALTCKDAVELELSATGGSGSYEYSTDNITFLPMTGNSINLPVTGVLGVGTYQYFVRDAANICTVVLSNSIEEDPIETLVLNLDTTAAFINCNGDNTASIIATADGGLGNYMYELYSKYDGVTLYASDVLEGPQSLGTFNNLVASTYYVNVTSEDCTAEPQRVDITEPTVLTVVDANDYTNVSCTGDEDGTITLELQGGVAPYQYAISPNLNKFDDENTFTDLAPGDYTIIAQDTNGCFLELLYTITEPIALSVIIDTVTPETCFGEKDGGITIDIQGGTAPFRTAINSNSEVDFVDDRIDFTNLASDNYLIFVRDANDCATNMVVELESGVNLNATITPVYECSGDIPTNYLNITLEDSTVLEDVLYAIDSVDPADMQLTPDFRNSTPGTHYIAIRHSNGCIQTLDFDIENFDTLLLSAEEHNLNEITAVVTGGKKEYTYFFGDRDNGTDNTFIVTETGTYTVTVRDANGCEATQDIYMEFIDIIIPNFFTPDSDNQNDTWTPINQEAFPDILTIIFDRYGREVYRLGLNDDPWDGLYKQKELPTGDYWYVIKLKGIEDDREFVGHFTLYR